jgi:tetratricopeptide (TPR) repeat protein/predicted Ser/Thr protein kinase
MAEQGRFRGESKSPAKADAGAAVRSPSSAPGTSPSDLPPPVDAPTLAPGSSASDAPTIALSKFSSSDLPTLADATLRTPPPGPAVRNLQPVLGAGAILAGRYEILEILGEGGMGAVYKARDIELDRMVALKVIRPELAKNRAIIERFKKELLLSQRVTHRNVIRIYDLGEGDGVKFITMEFVEGEDLRSLIHERKKFSPEEAVAIMEQICLALDAAHQVNVIHRDLKPQNVMRDKAGRILVMDFGLARTFEGDGMTQTGALVGTMEYMSPEQALAKELDHRSDIFSAGLIFYELLTGVMPYRADSALASLIRRTQERAKPISDHDSTIPQSLTNIVSKCLEREPAARYQTSKELLADLEAWQGKRAAGAIAFPSVKPWGQTIPWQWIGGIAAVLLLAIVGFLFRDKLRVSHKTSVVAPPEVALAILPFRNATQDAALDWYGPTLANMLSTDVGQSSHLRTISPDRLHQVLSDLRITANASIDPTMVNRIAEFSGADTVVWGQYAKFGDQIRVDATLRDLKRDRHVPLKIENVSEKDIPGAVDRLADAIRQNLSVSQDILSELKASSYQPTSKSPEALRAYNQGLQLLREGKNLEAATSLQTAVKKDPQFALAYSRLAEADSALGYDSQAENSARKAVELGQNLPPAEKYLIEASHFRIAKDYPKAIEAYKNLAKVSPDNSDIQSALGSIYESSGDFANAREFYQKLLAVNPKDTVTLLAVGRVDIQTGNPQNSLDPLSRALSLAIQVDNQELKGTILQALGIAYSSLNKPEDALQNYKQALEIRQRLGQKRGIADGLTMMADTYKGLGKSELALRDYNDALRLYREIDDQQDIGGVLLNLGQFYNERGRYDEALKLLKESLQIQRDLHNTNDEALCLNNIGNSYYFKGDYNDARVYFDQALQLREKINVPIDIALTVHNLAEVAVKSGHYDQAVTQHMRALDLYRGAGDKHGTAMEGYTLGTVFEYQGRYGSAVSSKKQAVQDFRDTQDRGFWMAEALGGYGSALTEAGQFDEGLKNLTEAARLSSDLKNDTLVVEDLNWQGDNAFYRGDVKSARSLYDQALNRASKTGDRNPLLVSKLNSSKADIAAGQAQRAIATLKGVSDEADSLGLKYLSLECSIYEAEARIQLRDYLRAQQQLERTILQTENLGLRPLLLRAHFSLGKMFRDKGAPADATPHYRQALTLLDTLRKEPGGDKILERADFKAIYTESDQWVRQHP